MLGSMRQAYRLNAEPWTRNRAVNMCNVNVGIFLLFFLSKENVVNLILVDLGLISGFSSSKWDKKTISVTWTVCISRGNTICFYRARLELWIPWCEFGITSKIASCTNNCCIKIHIQNLYSCNAMYIVWKHLKRSMANIVLCPLCSYMNYKNGLETASNMTYTINAWQLMTLVWLDEC